MPKSARCLNDRDEAVGQPVRSMKGIELRRGMETRASCIVSRRGTRRPINVLQGDEDGQHDMNGMLGDQDLMELEKGESAKRDPGFLDDLSSRGGFESLTEFHFPAGQAEDAGIGRLGALDEENALA